jgi:integrase
MSSPKIRRPFKLPGRSSFYVDIGRKRRSLKTSDPAEALRIYNELSAAQQRAESKPVATSNPGQPVRLSVFKQQYLDWSEKTRPIATFRAEKLAFDKLLEIVEDDPHLHELTAQHLDRVMAHLKNGGKAIASVNHYARHLKAIFGRAESWNLVSANPFTRVRLIRQPQGPPKRLSAGDLPKLFAAIDDPRLLALVKAFLSTGRRRGELLRLTWEDIDLEHGRYFIKRAKDHLSRWYPISKAFRAVLEGLPQPHTGRVFPWQSGDSVTHLVKAALVKAGYPQLHLHHLRHSFGAAYIEAGGDIRTLMELLGHQQISTTLIYTKLSPEHLAKEINRIELPEEDDEKA